MLEELQRASDDDVDDIVDEVTELMQVDGPSTEAAQFLIAAVGRARSELSLRSAAVNLALFAEADNYEAVQILKSTYERVHDHAFLAPALLDALGVLALRSALARSELTTKLLLLQRHSEEHLLIRASKWIGRLDGLRADPALVAKLEDFLRADSLVVQAEARQQLAFVALRDALLATTRDELRVRLVAARAAFARAELSDELRPDARTLIVIVDMMLAFMKLDIERDGAITRLEELSAELRDLLRPTANMGWWDHQSEHWTRRTIGVLSISDSLMEGAKSINTADEWMNLNNALEGLARLYSQIRAESGYLTHLPQPLDGIGDMIFADSLGPLLLWAVNLKQLKLALDRYTSVHEEDETSRGLRALLASATAVDIASIQSIPEDLFSAISEFAIRRGMSPNTIMKDLKTAIDDGKLAQWAEAMSEGALRIEWSDLYGADPSIDEVVRSLLGQLSQRLIRYDPLKGDRLISLVTSLVKFVNFVQDTMPSYVKRQRDGGLGQTASEDDLQESLYEALRREYGPAVDYESVRIGGGRPDIVVRFPEARFPIEVKHEFTSVDADHIRSNFIYQADFYAAATDRVSFLMILDLRSGNAGDVVPKRVSAQKTGPFPAPNPLYHLSDCFRIESMPPDPDMPGASTKAVVIGLIQGNRPLPSSMSAYSRRPRSKNATN